MDMITLDEFNWYLNNFSTPLYTSQEIYEANKQEIILG